MAACRENKVDVFVDDSPKNCAEVRDELHIPVIGFASKITANELKRRGIPSAKTWAELKEALSKIA